jgi:pimeloyl-ACP methyl ester carboxylesterase
VTDRHLAGCQFGVKRFVSPDKPTWEAPVTTAQTQTYADAPTKVVAAANGFDYAYRDVGSGTVPLVLLQHFRGNLDNWDPALIDALASHRRVVAFDNVGVGGTNGTTANTVEQMAADAISFLDALEFDRVDILGFSIGSFVAQEIALTRPALVRNLILASSAPKGAAGMHGWAPWVIDAVGKPQPDPVGYLKVFFTQSASSGHAGQQALQRMFTRTGGQDQPTTWQTRQAQYDAVCAWGIPNHALLQRLSAIRQPVFVANGDSDPMILPHFSYLLAGLIPGARVKIYPDSAHGFLFQHHVEFAADVEQFVSSNDIDSPASGGSDG